MMDRRSFFSGAAAFLAAPAIIRVASLMPISVADEWFIESIESSTFTLLTPTAVTREALRMLHQKLNFVARLDTPTNFSRPLRIHLPEHYTVKVGA